MANWKKLVIATGSSAQYIKGDGTLGSYSTSDSSKLPLTGGTLTGNVTAPNLIANTAVYSGGIVYGSTTLDLKDNGGNNFARFSTSSGTKFATFYGHISFLSLGTSTPVNRYLMANNTDTGTGSITIQAGAGSAGYGGGLKLFAHSHASSAGSVKAGISASSGGKFAVNTYGNSAGTDVFTVDASGNTVTSGESRIQKDNGQFIIQRTSSTHQAQMWMSGTQAYFGSTNGTTVNIKTSNINALIINTSQNATFTSNLTVNGGLYAAGAIYADENIYHNGDTDNKIRFEANKVTLSNTDGTNILNPTAAGTSRLNVSAIKSGDTNPYKIGGISTIFNSSAWLSATVSLLGPALTGYGTGIEYLKFDTDGTNKKAMFQGPLGIGTSPSAKLEILNSVGNGTAYDVIKIDADSGNFGGQWITNTWGNGQQGRIGFYGTGTTSATRGTALIGGSGTTPHLFVNGSGNVGIGTNSPSALIQIGSNDVANTGLRITNQGVVNAKSIIGFGGSNTQPMSAIGGIVESATANTAGGIYFSTRSSTNNDAPIERMRITSAGNLGIGTDSPAEKLHVNGGHLEVQNGGNTNVIINSASGSDGSVYFQEGGGMKARVYNDASADALVLTDGADTTTLTLAGTNATFAGSGKFNRNDSITTGADTNRSLYLKQAGTGDVNLVFSDDTISFNMGIDNSANTFKISTHSHELHTNTKFTLDTNGNATFSGNTISTGSLQVQGANAEFKIKDAGLHFYRQYINSSDQNRYTYYNTTLIQAYSPTAGWDIRGNVGFQSDVTLAGTLNVPEYIKHVNNTSNYLRFQNNQLDIANTTTKFVSSEILMSNDYAIKWNSGNTRIYAHESNNHMRFDVNGTSEVFKLQGTGIATIRGSDGNNAILHLNADNADNNADHWRIESTTDNFLRIATRNSGSYETKFEIGASDGLVRIKNNFRVDGGQIITPSGVNLALNPNTGTVSIGGVINATGTGTNQFAGHITVPANKKINIGGGDGIGALNVRQADGSNSRRNIVLDSGGSQQDWSFGTVTESNRVNFVLSKEYGNNSWGDALKVYNVDGKFEFLGGGGASFAGNVVLNGATKGIDFSGSGKHIISGSGSGSYIEINNVGQITPNSNNGFSLGTSSARWSNTFTQLLNVAGNSTFGGSINVKANTNFFTTLDAGTTASNLVFRASDESYIGQIEFSPDSVSQIVTRVNQPLAFGVNNSHKLTIGTDGNATFAGNISTQDITAYNQITIESADISNGENTGLKLVNTSGTDHTWHITNGQTGVSNENFTIRDSTNNRDVLVLASSGNATFAGDIDLDHSNIIRFTGDATTPTIGGDSSHLQFSAYSGIDHSVAVDSAQFLFTSNQAGTTTTIYGGGGLLTKGDVNIEPAGGAAGLWLKSTNSHANIRMINNNGATNSIDEWKIQSNTDHNLKFYNANVEKVAFSPDGLVTGVFLETFSHNFTDDLGTSDVYIPWQGTGENTTMGVSTTAFLTPFAMELVSFRIRPETITGSGTINVQFYKQANGSVSRTDIGMANTGTLSTNNVSILLANSFDILPTVSANEKVGFKFKASTDLSGTIDWYVTTVWKITKLI